MTWNRCSDLPPIDLYLTMMHSSTFSEFREALFCVTVFSAENTHSDLKLAASTTKTILARWDRIGNRPLCASQYGLVNWSASGRTLLQFTIYFLYWWMRELICDFWPSKLSHYPSRPGTRTFFQVPDPSGPGYCPNRWWALERSVCSDERPSPVTKSGKKLQMRRYCVAHVMLIILGPTQHAINHHL